MVQRVDDQDSEMKTFSLNKDCFTVVDVQMGVHPVGELGGFSLCFKFFYDFFMLILVDYQIQLEAVKLEQPLDVFALTVGCGVDSNLPTVISQLSEKIYGPVAQRFNVEPFVVPGQS